MDQRSGERQRVPACNVRPAALAGYGFAAACVALHYHHHADSNSDFSDVCVRDHVHGKYQSM
jgi:hypothetical protein